MLCCSAFIALMKRNLLLYRKRKIVGSVFELVLPVFFIGIIAWIKSQADKSDFFKPLEIPPSFQGEDSTYGIFSFTDYVAALHGKRYCNIKALTAFSDLTEQIGLTDGESNDYYITGYQTNGLLEELVLPVPFIKCDSIHCSSIGQEADVFCEYSILAVAPGTSDDEDGKDRVKAFQSYVYNRYPQLLNENKTLPFDHDFLQVFESSDAIDEYVKSKEYGNSENPKIAVGILFNGQDPNNYDYTIRVNSTHYNGVNPARGATTAPDTSRLFDHYAKVDDVCSSAGGGILGSLLGGKSCTQEYADNGALAIQRLIDDFIMVDSGAKEVGYFVSEQGVKYVPFPRPGYETGSFYSAFGSFTPFFVALGLIYPVSVMIRFVVTEKQLRQKELMKMMSATEGDIELSWFCSFFFFHLITIILLSFFSTTLFDKSSYVLILLLWLLLYSATILFSLALSSMTSKPTRCVMIGMCVFFSGIQLAASQSIEDGNPFLIQLIALHPLSAFAYACKEAFRLEEVGVGVTFDTFADTDSATGFTYLVGLRCLFVANVFWGFLMWYLNRVIAPDYGQPLPFYFPFTKSYWMPWKVDMSDDFTPVDTIDIPVEEVPENLKQQTLNKESIEIHNLRKEFKEKIAVDGLNLSMYSGQITALLGHNGAGKTTTINMLTGAMGPTSGHAKIGDKDIRTQMKSIRKEIGICLQHNCLFPQMTVREHLRFFCELKGVNQRMSKKELEDSIDQSIRDVALWDKRNTYSSKLSGGMQRKLSLAIAFCGDSKVVMLDEPTSGMDPFARRFTWNILQNYRKDRCIILTTHSMDEADILGDRIAIMSKGRLRCCGSSLFLKKTFGVGYQLTIEKQSVQVSEGSESRKNNDNEITNMITGTVPEAQLLSDVGTELSFQIPRGEATTFIEMFEKLDLAQDQGSIQSYGVGITTLDEVFQVIARESDLAEKVTFESSKSKSKQMDNSGDEIEQTYETESEKYTDEIQKVKSMFLTHFVALFKKRMANFRRDKRAWLCTTILPSLFVIFGLLLITLRSSARNLDALPLSLDDYNVGMEPKNPLPFNTKDSKYVCQPGKCSFTPAQTNMFLFNTNENFTFCGAQAKLDSTSLCTIEQSNDITSRITDDGAVPIATDVSTILESSIKINELKSDFGASQYGAIFLTHEATSIVTSSNLNVTSESNRTENVTLDGSSLSENLTYGDLAYEMCMRNKGDYILDSECENYRGLGYLINYNFTALHAAPLLQAITDEAIIRHAINKDDFKISATIHPLPITHSERAEKKSADATTLWFLIVLSFPLIAGAFATFVVAEKLSKAKHLQVVAGVQPWAYWLSTFAWDILNYQFPLWITVILLFAFDAEALTTTEKDTFQGILAIFILFGPAAAPFSYCVSFFFKSPTACNIFIIVLGFIIGLAGPMIVFILRTLGGLGDALPKLALAADILEGVLRIFPSFCLGKGLFFAIQMPTISLIEGTKSVLTSATSGLNPDLADLLLDMDPIKTAFDKRILLHEIYALILQAFLYLGLTIMIEALSTSPKFLAMLNKVIHVLAYPFKMLLAPKNAPSPPDDSDVIVEKQRVESGEADNDLIVIDGLTKIYGDGKKAVDNLSLGIHPGECFGLLGINGAGKTTTMAMLTAEFPPSSGDAKLAGFSVCKQAAKTRRRIGYCPQFDAHFSNMTGREHIELYASIKGMPGNRIKQLASAKLKDVGLSEYDANRLSAKYSGGMKRKLSLACATIGKPQIIFLDECTTGVDPVARREIWQMISDMVTDTNNPTCVVLTTHSMEECEALCPRIGIMANGKLRCLGSAQHLKTKFGRGYQIELNINSKRTGDSEYNKIFFELGEGKLSKNDSAPDMESASDVDGSKIFFTLQQAKDALQKNTDNLSHKLNAEDENGSLVYREAMSETGVSLDTLASFVIGEIRMNNIDSFVRSTFENPVLREKLTNKVRYEISSNNLRISKVFTEIEGNKTKLSLADYSISQTSLEQVFNIHAKEAEELKSQKLSK